jgi:hypothetical protein
MSSSSSSVTSSSSSSSRAPTGTYAVSRVDIPAIPGVTKGTGAHTVTKLLLDPTTVPGAGPLAFVSADVHMTTYLYQLDQDVIPKFFGVAVPDTVTDYIRPIIYFHPTPPATTYKETEPDPADPTKTRNPYFFLADRGGTDLDMAWRNIYAYIDRLSQQLAGAVRLPGVNPDQIVIVPFVTASRIGNAGIFPKNWHDIVTDILTDLRALRTGQDGPLTINETVLAGFSAGFACMMAFRSAAGASLSSSLVQIWDFDGAPKSLSNPLGNNTPPVAVKYDQGNEPHSNHLPQTRWAAYPDTPPDEEPSLPAKNDLHHLIRDFMFLHAASQR